MAYLSLVKARGMTCDAEMITVNEISEAKP
jgi:hypothetical protein